MRTVRILALGTVAWAIGATISSAEVLDRLSFAAPGISFRSICTPPVPGDGVCHLPGDLGGPEFAFPGNGVGGHIDAAGARYYFDTQSYMCGGSTARDVRLYRVRPDGRAETVATFSGCSPSVLDQMFATGLTVDQVNGKALIIVGGGNIAREVIEISGLPTVLDIIATFEPATGTLSWVTPKHPMGLPAADSFQVFAGDLSDLPDFGRAVPIACTVPEIGPPQPGEHLTVQDPLPDPPPGRGRYVLIGVEHAGQRRFGRQNINGVLSGRDPVDFPACN